MLADGFEAILDYAERRMRKRIAELPAGTYLAEDCLDDDGSSDEPVVIKLRVDVTPRQAHARLRRLVAAAARQHQCRGADDAFGRVLRHQDPHRRDHPRQRRHLAPVEIKIPAGSFLDAQPPAAVCAGNTETTQRVADTVLKAFAQFAPARIPAASQGTMNLIGVGGVDPRNGRSYTYIETIAGGQGGRPDGATAWTASSAT